MITIGDTIPSMPLVFPCVVAIVLELPWNRLGIFPHLPCNVSGQREKKRAVEVVKQLSREYSGSCSLKDTAQNHTKRMCKSRGRFASTGHSKVGICITAPGEMMATQL